MNKEQLLQSLAELETQLKGIKSATEQIDLLINTDKQLLQSVTNFVNVSHNNITQVREIYQTALTELSKLSKEDAVSKQDTVKKFKETCISELQKSIGVIIDIVSNDVSENSKMIRKYSEESIRSMNESGLAVKTVSDELIKVISEQLKPSVITLEKIVNETLVNFIDKVETILKDSETRQESRLSKLKEEISSKLDFIVDAQSRLFENIDNKLENIDNIQAERLLAFERNVKSESKLVKDAISKLSGKVKEQVEESNTNIEARFTTLENKMISENMILKIMLCISIAVTILLAFLK